MHRTSVRASVIQSLNNGYGKTTAPYTILRATQFFEFVGAIAQSATVGETVRLSPALFQPIAAKDVFEAVADIAVGAPVNGTLEIAGPESVALDKLVRRFLTAKKDPRKVVSDIHAPYQLFLIHPSAFFLFIPPRYPLESV